MTKPVLLQSAENPNPCQPVATQNSNPRQQHQKRSHHQLPTGSKLNEEPLYPTSGIVSRRAPILETSGPVFELKLNVTDSELIIVADSSQADTSTVILRSGNYMTHLFSVCFL